MRLSKLFTHSTTVLLLIVSIYSIIMVITSVFNLPEVKSGFIRIGISETESKKLGKFGEMMLEMLPNNLGFTLFVPTESAIERILNLKHNRSLDPKERDNIYATISHVLSFSSVPRKIYSGLVGVGKVVVFDSISGFELRVWRDSGGGLVVNGVRSERVDMEKGEVVVHLMDGVIMDAEFEQSVVVLVGDEEK